MANANGSVEGILVEEGVSPSTNDPHHDVREKEDFMCQTAAVKCSEVLGGKVVKHHPVHNTSIALPLKGGNQWRF